jgi:hypothetical protein
MAILKAQKKTSYPLKFSKRDANLEGALTEWFLKKLYDAALVGGKPIPPKLEQHVLGRNKSRKAASRPIDVKKQLKRISLGCFVEHLERRMKRTEAIERVAKDFGLEQAYVSSAHSYFMRLADISNRRGRARKE